MTKDSQINQNPNAGVTLRAVILGLLLIPINTYFIIAHHAVAYLQRYYYVDDTDHNQFPDSTCFT